jgi:hypothetical protein
MSTNQLIRRSPSGPVLQYPTSLAGNVLTVLPDGTVDPSASALTPATSRIVFVSSVFGSDATGDGTMARPYATIAKAYSTITTASSAAPWQIVLFQGTYAENVAVKAFVRIEGWDKAKTASGSYPARITGTITLGTSFATAGAYAHLTAVDINGTTTLDFSGSADGQVFCTGCQFEDDVGYSGVALNIVEMHECTLFGNVTQTGCTALWQNTDNQNGSLLHVLAGSAINARLDLYNSTWVGALTAEATTDGTCTINLFDSEVRSGVVTTVAAGANNPIVNGAFGTLPENVLITGSAARAMNEQMRVSQVLTIASGITLAASSVTEVTIPLTDTFFGQTSIEALACCLTFSGAAWITLVTQQIIWSWYVLRNAGTNEVHVVFLNLDVEQTTPAGLGLLLSAYLPSTVGT